MVSRRKGESLEDFRVRYRAYNNARYATPEMKARKITYMEYLRETPGYRGRESERNYQYNRLHAEEIRAYKAKWSADNKGKPVRILELEVF